MRSRARFWQRASQPGSAPYISFRRSAAVMLNHDSERRDCMAAVAACEVDEIAARRNIAYRDHDQPDTRHDLVPSTTRNSTLIRDCEVRIIDAFRGWGELREFAGK